MFSLLLAYIHHIHTPPCITFSTASQVSIHRYVSIPNGIRSVSAQMENNDLSTVRMVVNT